MDKERAPKFESGFSEKQMDLAVDRVLPNDQVKAQQIFDLKKNKKVKNDLLTENK